MARTVSVGAAFAVCILLGCGASTSRPRPAPSDPVAPVCETADARRAAIWSGDSADALRDHLRSLDTSHDPTLPQLVLERVNRTAHGWRDGVEEACGGGETSDLEREASLRCLHLQGHALEALREALTAAPVEQVIAAPDALVDLELQMAWCLGGPHQRAHLEEVEAGAAPPLAALEAAARAFARSQALLALHGPTETTRDALEAADAAATEAGSMHLRALVAYALGVVHMRADRPTEAEASFLRARRSYSTYGSAQGRMKTVEWIASLRFREGRAEEALERAQRVLADQESVFGEDHPALGFPLWLVGVSQNALGRPGDAIVILERLVALYAQALGDNHAMTAMGRQALAWAIWDRGRQDLAAEGLVRAHADLRDQLGAASDHAIHARMDLGYFASMRGLWREAEAHFETAASLYALHGDRMAAERAGALASLARIRARQGDLDGAVSAMELALEVLPRSEGPDSALPWAAARIELASLHGQADRYQEALEGVAEARASEGELLPDVDLEATRVRGEALVRLGRAEEGIAALEEAVAKAERLEPPSPLSVAETRFRLAQAARAAGDGARWEEEVRRSAPLLVERLAPTAPVRREAERALDEIGEVGQGGSP